MFSRPPAASVGPLEFSDGPGGLHVLEWCEKTRLLELWQTGLVLILSFGFRACRAGAWRPRTYPALRRLPTQLRWTGRRHRGARTGPPFGTDNGAYSCISYLVGYK